MSKRKNKHSGKFDTIHRADLRISDIGNLLGSDWVRVAHELGVADSDINIIKSEYPDNHGELSRTLRSPAKFVCALKSPRHEI
jgi:hypothetical protein